MVAFGRSRKKSKEVMIPTSEPPTAATTAPTGHDPIKEALSLIQEDKIDGAAIQKRRRNSTPAIMQQNMPEHGAPVKVKLPGVMRVDSTEAAEINELIKETKKDGGGAVRERRKSKESLKPLTAQPQKKKEEETVSKAVSPEVAAINQKIAEDRRQRRASKELDAAKFAAEERLMSMESEVRRAEADAEAEAAALQHDSNLADARARGAAKAAATRAGGVFHTKGEWQALQTAQKDEVASLERRIEELEEKLYATTRKLEGGESSPSKGSILGMLGGSFKRTKSPAALRSAASPSGLRRQASASSFTQASAASFKKLFIKKSQGTASAPKVAFTHNPEVLAIDRDPPPTPSGGTLAPHVR
jgi:hypothetical protein